MERARDRSGDRSGFRARHCPVRDLVRLPLNLSVDWISKTVTTDPPKLMPHEEWRLAVSIDAPSPIHAVVIWYVADEMTWGCWQYEPSARIDLPLHFFPHAWNSSDEVALSFGWRRIGVSDARLKVDPVKETNVLAPSTAETGQTIPVCKLRNDPVTAAVFTVASEDTELRRRHRWRVLPELAEALPTDLLGLTSGHQSGTGRTDLGPPPATTP